MSIENWLIGIVCALVGGYAGHNLSNRVYSQRVKSLKQAMDDEFEFLKIEMERWFPKLLDENQQPRRNEYSVIPSLDLSLADSIVIELASTSYRVTKEQRKFMIRLKFLLAHSNEIDLQRGVLIKKLFEAGHSEIRELSNKISFLSAQLLIDSAETIFYSTKFLEEKSNFKISTHHSYQDYIKVACELSGIEFNPTVWRMVFAQAGIDEKIL